MSQRRFAWLLGSVSVFAFLAGCRGDASSSSSSVDPPESAARLASVADGATKRGLELLRATKSFRVPAVPGIKGHAMLTASPVVSFVAENAGAPNATLLALTKAPKRRQPSVSVRLPTVANASVSVESQGMRITLQPRGFSAAHLEWAERIAVYPNALEGEAGTHVFRRVDDDGVEDFFHVQSARDTLSYTYDVTMSGVAGLRLVGGSLELLDAGGAPRLAAPTPWLVDAKGVRRLGTISVSGCNYDSDPSGPWGRPVTAPGATTCTVTASIDGKGLAYPVLVDPAWRSTFNTKQTHAYHEMLLLPAGKDAGKVLLLGGTGSAPQSTELFDPASNSWATAASVSGSIDFGAGNGAAVLPDGTVLLGGGLPASGGTSLTSRASVVRRDPATGTWTPAAAMGVGRAYHTFVAVKVGGKDLILAAGGQPKDYLSTTSSAYKSAELYDPSVDGWKGITGTMGQPHSRAGAAVMSSGKVLIGGGYTTSDYDSISAAEVFDPATSSFSASPTMGDNRGGPVVVALKTGGAMVFGGIDFGGNELGTIEYFDGTTFTTLTAKLAQPMAFGAAAQIDDGRVLVTGGQFDDMSSGDTIALDAVALFAPGTDPKTGTVTDTAGMTSPRRFHSLVNLTGVGALVAGGDNGSSEISGSEIFDTTVGGACTTTCPAGLYCTEGVCCTSASCPEGQTCKAPGHEGICAKAKGATCTGGSECATGHCVDGVCCDTACNTECRSCNVAGKVGSCTTATLGTDPGGKCAAIFGGDPICGTSCGSSGSCDYDPPDGTPCGTSAVDAGPDGDTGSFCDRSACNFGYCEKATYDCGLTCTTSVTCNEATRSCTPTSSGIKSGYCVIDGACWSYGDLDPKDKCHFCDPPTSKTTWSDACKDGGVGDTGTDGGADTGKADTGTTADTGPAADTGTAVDTGTGTDASVDDAGSGSDLPSASSCGCEMPGGEHGRAGTTGLAALGLAIAGIAARRRRG